MSVDWDGGSWTCGGAVAAKSFSIKAVTSGSTPSQDDDSQKSSSRIPKAILALPPDKRPKKAKRLKPDRWRASFDSEGRLIGFQKLLKFIKSGGVDHSIRAEVWEFLLGCYGADTTTSYRGKIRQARRKRYKELIEQCRLMHSSVGTGCLAYTVGSRMMDVRIISKDSAMKDAKKGVERVNMEALARLQNLVDGHATRVTEDETCIYDETETNLTVNCEGPGGDGSIPMAFNALYSMSSLGVDSSDCPDSDSDIGPESPSGTRDLSSDHRHRLPFRDLFVSDDLRRGSKPKHRRGFGSQRAASFHGREQRDSVITALNFDQIDSGVNDFEEPGQAEVTSVTKRRFSNLSKEFTASRAPQDQDISLDLVEGTEARESAPMSEFHMGEREKRTFDRDSSSERGTSRNSVQYDLEPQLSNAPAVMKEEPEQAQRAASKRRETVSRRTSFSELAARDPVVALSVDVDEERVAEWLWTLHKIVVDVVRTDRHLEFYGDTKNMARMSDILAVYAWIDPSTGYCQGMSDLLSPFIVLFDDDADAFWCFESLLRRVRKNFQMEGPVGVMKQLDALSKIMETADVEMSKHLTLIGADSFLFAFRMLLVLFRRELTFGESLYMWEMMWAADYDQAMAWALEYNCLEALILRLPSTMLEEQIQVETEVPFPQSPELKSDFSGSSPHDELSDPSTPGSFGRMLPLKRRPFCGIKPAHFWVKNRQPTPTTVTGLLGRNGDEELSVFCVAAVLVQNRTKLLKEIQSMDDAIKIFNDMQMTVKVHSCVHTAIKLRKKYRTQLAKRVAIERRALSRHPRSFHSF